MFFRDYGSNPWEDPRRDNLSTFAMDVDTGAYTVLRSYLREGFLPPAAAIRVEELVNYFDQDYPAPDGAAFRISADGAPSPFGERHGTLVRVGIQGRQADALPELDAVLTFVVDASGSMADGERLELVKAALRRLVDQLDAGDEVGIVAFSDQAWVALPTTSVGQQSAILEAIDALEPQASTNAEAGLVQGYELAERAFRRGAINRVILCSDGVANVGAVMPEDILERIRRGAERDLTLTTVGVGMGNYNDVLMEQLADRGDGAYFYVDDLRQAERIFVDRLAGTLQVIARDAKTQVELNPEVVAAYRLIGYENRGLADSDFDRPEVDAGEIGAGQSVTALYSVQLHPEARGRLATVRIRYREPDSGGNREVSTELHTADLAERFDQAAPRFRLDVAVAAFAEALRQQGDYQQLWLDDVIQIAEAAARDLGDADATELVELMGRARALVTYTTR
jgi:Ca-activated chloride channel family protein